MNQNSASVSSAQKIKKWGERVCKAGNERKSQAKAKRAGGTGAGENCHLKRRRKYTSEQSEPTRFSGLYNLILSRITWKMLVVDSVGLPAKHTLKTLRGALTFAQSWNESWAQIKVRENVKETHFFNCMQGKTFHNWKMQAVTANPGAQRPYLINHSCQVPFCKQQAVDTQNIFCFLWKTKKGDDEMYKSLK